MAAPKVRLVVLNYNGGGLVERCVEHLEALAWPEDRLDLVVIDNCSSDGSPDSVAERHPRVRVIRAARNGGFPANNLGLRDLAGIDYVGLVNNDAFVEPGWLEPLVSALESDHALGAACPKIVFEPRFVEVVVNAPTWRAPGDGRELSVQITGVRVDGIDAFDEAQYGRGCHALEHDGTRPFRWLSGHSTIWIPVVDGNAPGVVAIELSAATPTKVEVAAGGPATAALVDARAWVEADVAGGPFDVVNNVGSVLVEGGYGGDRGFLERDRGQYDEPQDVFAWCGAGVLFRPGYLDEVGLFDERFFMYYEDTDLAWRGQALGWRYRYVPQAKIRHVHAATSVEGSALFRFWVERNRLFLLTKNAPAMLAWRGVVGLAGSILSTLVRDGLRPLLRGRRPSVGQARTRAKSLLSYVAMLPAMLGERRRLRRRQVVADAAILAWAVPR